MSFPERAVSCSRGEDTLLTLRSATFNLGFWQLLKGNVEVMDVALDGLTVDFVKENQQANYDFLFRSRSNGEKKRNGLPKGGI